MERRGEKRKGTETEREISSFSRCALRDILLVSSRLVSILISEILNAPIPSRERETNTSSSSPPTSPSSFLSLLKFFPLSLTESRSSTMHDSTCAHARVRTSSTPADNLDAASSADVSSYLVLKAMTLSPIRAIIHLSWLSSPLALFSAVLVPFLSFSRSFLSSRLDPPRFHEERDRKGERGEGDRKRCRRNI